MTEVVATAPGKIILFGEHAVVYGYPAIAVPLHALRARAIVRPGESAQGLQIIAANLGRTLTVFPEPYENDHALVVAVRLLMTHLQTPLPAYQILLHSTIPLASGLGSGAAATTALLRGLAQMMARSLEADALNDLVFEIEKLYHGTPSGIDNTVIVYEKPVYFTRGQPIETFEIGHPLHWVVADTGIASSTRVTVRDVRALYNEDSARIGPIFKRIGDIGQVARQAIEAGDAMALGLLMRENHGLLRELTVSSPCLDKLVSVAEAAGAYGAKLSGGGRGGNLIALTPPQAILAVISALEDAGARRVIQTTLE